MPPEEHHRPLLDDAVGLHDSPWGLPPSARPWLTLIEAEKIAVFELERLPVVVAPQATAGNSPRRSSQRGASEPFNSPRIAGFNPLGLFVRAPSLIMHLPLLYATLVERSPSILPSH